MAWSKCTRTNNTSGRFLKSMPFTLVLPNHLHREYAVRAAAAGIHVLCEKPMAVTEEECEAMIDAATSNDVKLMTWESIASTQPVTCSRPNRLRFVLSAQTTEKRGSGGSTK